MTLYVHVYFQRILKVKILIAAGYVNVVKLLSFSYIHLGLLPKISNVPEQALGGCPLGLRLVVEERALEFSCNYIIISFIRAQITNCDMHRMKFKRMQIFIVTCS